MTDVSENESVQARKIAELESEISRLRHELSIRSELARVVTSYGSPRELLPNVLQVLCDGFGANGGAIYFMGRDSNEIELKATHGLDHSYAVRYQKIHLGSHVTGVVAETGEGMIIKDASMDRRSTKGVVQMLKYRSAVVTPVTSKNEVVGIIALINEEPDFFSSRDLKLLEFLGSHISLAIVNSFLNEEMSLERERTLEILDQVEEGIFQAEVEEAIEMGPDLEAIAVSFYQNARFTQLNPSFVRQCSKNLEHGSFIHRGFEDIQLFRMLKEVFRGGSVKGVERKWYGEEERLFEVSIVSMGKGDRIKGVMGTRRDITKRMRMEEDLKASRSKTSLYMNVLSHDVSNINSQVMGYLNILKDKLEGDQHLKGLVENSMESIERSTQMVGKVKSISRVQKRKDEMSMADLVEKMNLNLSCVKREYPSRTIEMDIKSGNGPVFIRCDEMIDDLLSNLFRNSIMNEEKPTVMITAEIKKYEYGGRSGYLMTLFDNGKGTPDDVKRMITDHLDHSEDECMPGSKLGLILVRSIVERYGGRIWFEDDDPMVKRGSRLMLFFPSF